MLTDFFPGSQFRQYKLLEQIGVGGIGLVWSALDQIQNRIVAIKLNKIDEDNQAVNLFMLDRHITGLHHPCILPTYDFGIWKNIQYIVTPYIPGGSLEDRISERTPFPLSEALQYAAEIVSALDYLHGENVIHRDLKPANILINFDYHLYLADFDLARVLSQTTQSMHTGRGTPAYAPPEQHTKAAITLQSDLYSLGIVLYEMFTLKLPWNGEKSLGIEQLSGGAYLPDPVEVNPSLPADLVYALRKMTAPNPDDRPATAGEALQMVYDSFKMEPIKIPARMMQNEDENRKADSAELLRRSLDEWLTSQGRVIPNLTKFAYIDIIQRNINATLPENTLRFMLNTALIYGYQNEYWWKKLANPAERLAVSGKLVHKNNEIGAERIVDHLSRDIEIQALKAPMPKGMVKTLLEITYKTQNEALREKILSLLRALLPPARRWRDLAISFEDDTNLALQAIQGDPAGDKAALLIGHLRSTSAAQAVLKTVKPERRMPVFQAIHYAAGSLPGSIPIDLRTAVTAAWVQKIITDQPLNLLMVFLMGFLGSALGSSLQIYFTYRLPTFLDVERITISVERGAVIGLIFGLSILFTRLLAERLTSLPAVPRVVLSAVIGGLGLNMGLFTFDVLFLKNNPHGVLLTIACILIAFGFAVSTLARNLPLKILISSLATISALGGSWWVHTTFGNGPTTISPVFFYEYTWTAAQVLGVVLLVSLPISILGNLFTLSLKEL